MKILVACEESQEVCKAFREKGHIAYSCDLQPCSGGHPEWHIQGNALDALNMEKWDMIIAFPPCTYLTPAGASNIPKHPTNIVEVPKAECVWFYKGKRKSMSKWYNIGDIKHRSQIRSKTFSSVAIAMAEQWG